MYLHTQNEMHNPLKIRFKFKLPCGICDEEISYFCISWMPRWDSERLIVVNSETIRFNFDFGFGFGLGFDIGSRHAAFVQNGQLLHVNRRSRFFGFGFEIIRSRDLFDLDLSDGIDSR